VKNVSCFEISVLALLLPTGSVHATDMQLITCAGGQKIEVEAPSKISGQAFDVRCDSDQPGQITFIYNLSGSENGLIVSIIKTEQMKTSFMANMLAEMTIEDTVVGARKSNITEVPQPNAVGKDSNNGLVIVFVAENSIIEIYEGRQSSSEAALIDFATGFAESVGSIISSWKG